MSTLQEFITISEQITAFITSTLVVPILIFFGAIIVGRVTSVLLAAFLRSVEFDSHAQKVFFYRADYVSVLSGSIAAILYTIGVVWALVEAGVIVLALQIVGGFLGVIFVVALVVWGIDFFPNLFSYRAVVKRFSPQDTVIVSAVSGTVQNIGWLSVTLITSDGLTIVVPHRTVKKSGKSASL